MAQLGECLTLGFGSGHDLVVLGSSSEWGSGLVWSLLEILNPSPLPLPAHIQSLFSQIYTHNLKQQQLAVQGQQCTCTLEASQQPESPHLHNAE